jgi:hypothetical protein
VVLVAVISPLVAVAMHQLLLLFLFSLSAAATPYNYQTYGEIVKTLQDLEQENPGLVELYTAQDRFKLKSPGRCKDHLQQDGPCEQWILRLTNEASLKQEEEERPEVHNLSFRCCHAI